MEDYRPFELLSECYHNLGFPDHALEYINSAIKCPGSPSSLFKKSALLYHSIGNFKEYFNFYIRYFDSLMVGNRNDNILVIYWCFPFQLIFIFIRFRTNWTLRLLPEFLATVHLKLTCLRS